MDHIDEIVCGEGYMNERSRRKKRLPKGLPFEADKEQSHKIKISQTKETFPIDFVSANCPTSFARPVLKGPHLIRRAYIEPIDNNMVENILLQRSYIID